MNDESISCQSQTGRYRFGFHSFSAAVYLCLCGSPGFTQPTPAWSTGTYPEGAPKQPVTVWACPGDVEHGTPGGGCTAFYEICWNASQQAGLV